MNERIKELVKQATIRVNNPFVNSDGKVVCDDWEEGVSLSKFAELIVRECAGIANKQFSAASGLDDRDSWTAAEMKKHFGVEE